MKTISLLFLLYATLFSGCLQHKEQTKENQQTSKENQQPAKENQQSVKENEVMVYPNLSDSLHRELMVQGAVLVHKSMFGIKSALMEALQKGGPLYALEFCNTQAIPITDSLARVLNVGVKRVAKKNRNPDNETNDFENTVYKEYVMGYIQKAIPKTRVDVDKDGHPVYYKLIDVKQECMVCHGKPYVDIPNDVATKIRALYPDDKAIDFEVGQPRGMWAITFNHILIKNDKP